MHAPDAAPASPLTAHVDRACPPSCARAAGTLPGRHTGESTCLACGGYIAHATAAFDVRPVGANVIVRPERVAPMSAGGLHIPEIAQYDLKRGRVVAVGPGRHHPGETAPWTEPAPAAVGDLVIWGARWQGDEFTRDGVSFRVLEPEQVLAVVEDAGGEHLHRLVDARY